MGGIFDDIPQGEGSAQGGGGLFDDIPSRGTVRAAPVNSRRTFKDMIPVTPARVPADLRMPAQDEAQYDADTETLRQRYNARSTEPVHPTPGRPSQFAFAAPTHEAEIEQQILAGYRDITFPDPAYATKVWGKPQLTPQEKEVWAQAETAKEMAKLRGESTQREQNDRELLQRGRVRKAEQREFDESRTLGRRTASADAFMASLPVRMLTHGNYGAADVAGLFPERSLIGATAPALRQAEEDFIRANRAGLEMAAQIGEAAMGVPPLAELGAVPGMALKSSLAANRQTGRLLSDIVAKPAGTTRLGAVTELGATVAEAVPGVPYMPGARQNALARVAAGTAPHPRTILQKIAGGGKDAWETVAGRLPGLRPSADARLYRMLERQNQTPEQALAYLEDGQRTAHFGRGQAALPETIADTGPAARRMTRTIEGIPGPAASRTEEFLGMRQRGTPIGAPKGQAQPGQFERVNDDLKRAMTVSNKDFARTKEALIRQQKETSAPLYEEFRNLKGKDGQSLLIDVGPILRASEEYDAELSPAIRRVMGKARQEFMDEIIVRDLDHGINREVKLGKEAVAGTASTARLTPARFDNAKRALDDMITAEEGRGHQFQVSLLVDLKNKLVQAADKASMRPVVQKQKITAYNEYGQPYELAVETPVSETGGQAARESIYAKARDAYSSPAAMQTALQKGRTFMRGDSEVTAAEYKALSTAEKRMFRIGMAKQAEVDLGSKTRGSDMVRYFDRPNVEGVLSEIMTPKRYQQFQKLLSREGGMLATRRSIQNSRTAALAEDIEDFDWMGKVIHSFKTKGVVGATAEFAGDIIKSMTRMREVDAMKMADLLFETDPAKQRNILQRVARKYGQSRVTAAFNAVAEQAERLAGTADPRQPAIADALLDLAMRARGALPPGSQALPGLQGNAPNRGAERQGFPPGR